MSSRILSERDNLNSIYKNIIHDICNYKKIYTNMNDQTIKWFEEKLYNFVILIQNNPTILYRVLIFLNLSCITGQCALFYNYQIDNYCKTNYLKNDDNVNNNFYLLLQKTYYEGEDNILSNEIKQYFLKILNDDMRNMNILIDKTLLNMKNNLLQSSKLLNDSNILHVWINDYNTNGYFLLFQIISLIKYNAINPYTNNQFTENSIKEIKIKYKYYFILYDIYVDKITSSSL